MIGRFLPCPHCQAPLAYLEGAESSSMTPKCPRCNHTVSVSRATFLMADNSRPVMRPKTTTRGRTE
jgi:phage FluMu protein Com